MELALSSVYIALTIVVHRPSFRVDYAGADMTLEFPLALSWSY